MTANARLAEMGIAIEPHRVFDNGYRVHAVRTGDLVFVSGQVSDDERGGVRGVVGLDIGIEEAQQAARICAINTLRSLASLGIGSDDVTKVVKVFGMVNGAPGFGDSAEVVHGASSFYRQVFGEAGIHARSAVVLGVPKNWAVEVEAVFEVGPS